MLRHIDMESHVIKKPHCDQWWVSYLRIFLSSVQLSNFTLAMRPSVHICRYFPSDEHVFSRFRKASPAPKTGEMTTIIKVVHIKM
jgi:hypothetical protein